MMQQTWDSRSIDPRDRVETIRTMLCENLVQTDLTLDPQGREEIMALLTALPRTRGVAVACAAGIPADVAGSGPGSKR